MILECDQEPATCKVQRAINEKGDSQKTVLENYPVESSASNGIVEKAVQDVEGQVRTTKSALLGDGELNWMTDDPMWLG